MNSLNILKQELINQKNLLEQKGFSVVTQNQNPSPSEITSAIENIDIDFAAANATEDDVTIGKTFYAQSGNLKTGTLDIEHIRMLSSFAVPMITGEGSAEIHIPTDSQYTKIRDYAFSDIAEENINRFYKHNLTIPSNIKTLGIRCFDFTNLTGTLTIPTTCTEVGVGAFEKTNISEVIVHNGLVSNSGSGYFCGYCPNLAKATILEPVSILPSYSFVDCPMLKEVYLPTTMSNLASSCLNKCTAVELVKFTGSTPPVCASATFKQANNAVLLVPYQYYNDYYTASNYLVNGNTMIGYGEFSAGDNLPSSTTGYNIRWYPTLQDAKNLTNNVTSCPNSGTMYAVFTAV